LKLIEDLEGLQGDQGQEVGEMDKRDVDRLIKYIASHIPLLYTIIKRATSSRT
jgi:hypothetical protein